MKIITVNVGSFGVNCYIVYNGTEAALIDPGAQYDKIKAVLALNGLTAKAVLLTHGHFDHTGAVENFRRDGASVWISKADEVMLNDPILNVSRYFGMDFTPTQADFNYSDALDVCGMHFDVITTPGHTMGGVCLYGRDEKVLFSGDTLFLSSVGRCDFPGSDGLMLIKSIKEKLFTLPGDTVVYPGHNSPTTIRDEILYNPFVR